MDLSDTRGHRLYLTADERRAFLNAAKDAALPVRTFCLVLHYTGCRISEALALTPQRFDFAGRTIVFRNPQETPPGCLQGRSGPRGGASIP